MDAYVSEKKDQDRRDDDGDESSHRLFYLFCLLFCQIIIHSICILQRSVFMVLLKDAGGLYGLLGLVQG